MVLRCRKIKGMVLEPIDQLMMKSGDFGRRNLLYTLNLYLDFQGSKEISVLKRKVEIGIESE